MPIKENLYHNLFTYNFLNGGQSGSYTNFMSGFNIIMENGCPSWAEFDDPVLCPNCGNNKFVYWMTGYDKYKSGLQNSIAGIPVFSSSLDPNVGLANLKHWVADHGCAAQTGSLAIIGIYTDYWSPCNLIPAGSPQHANEYFIKSLGTTGGHALTIVGFNDEIWIKDINNNGQFTNDQDVNLDGVINILDFEKGAFKVANSWLNWTCSNSNFSWLPYNLFYPSNPGFVTKYTNPDIAYAYSCDVFESSTIPETAINIKASLEHSCREKLQCKAGYASSASATVATVSSNYNSFNFQGGYNSMRGAYTGPIEIGLNHSYFFNPNDVGKVFFEITEQNDPNNMSNGLIKSFSLVDHRWGEDFELSCSQTNIPIVNNGNTTLSIDYHLLPHEYPITTNLTVNSNRVSRFTPTVTGGAILTVTNGANIDMYNSEIHIDAGSSLVLGNGTSIIAKKGTCKLIIDGNISLGTNVHFLSDEGAQLEVILNNTALQTSFTQSRFERSILTSNVQTLSISGSTFIDCFNIHSTRGNVTVSSSVFENTWLLLEEQTNNAGLIAKVSGCTFGGINTVKAIEVWNYGKYLIENNIIDGYINGIQLHYSGYGSTGNQKVISNTISNCINSGVLLYNSIGIIEGNNIHNNTIGVRLMNGSNAALIGNSSAQYCSQTQQIMDNSGYEIYASQFSFPWYFHYNAIVDEDNVGNPTDPMVFYDKKNLPPLAKLDVINNYWGVNFEPELDLKTIYGIYKSYPSWTPGGGGILIDPILDMYQSGVEQFESENYLAAKNIFQLLINQYPKSEYAQAAMKELIRLEKFLSSDFEGLRSFYQTNDSIIADNNLIKLGDILANKCDEKLENWLQAIQWYENRILNPTCLEDSVFAIIDLGNLYFLMQNQGLKSCYTGTLKEFKPESKEKYVVHRDFLLSLLPGESIYSNENNDLTIIDKSRMLCNIPNPFAERTIIKYKLEKQFHVTISITDLVGKEINKFDEGVKEKGVYELEYSNSDLESGIYFYTLILNGQIICTKKMNKMR